MLNGQRPMLCGTEHAMLNWGTGLQRKRARAELTGSEKAGGPSGGAEAGDEAGPCRRPDPERAHSPGRKGLLFSES